MISSVQEPATDKKYIRKEAIGFIQMTKHKFTSDERREQIIRDSVRVFAQHGLDGAKTRMIAEACGVNEALIYRHFSSKEDLYIEAMHYVHDQLFKRLQETAEQAKDGFEALRILSETRIESLYENKQMCLHIIHGIATCHKDPKLEKMNQTWFLRSDEFIKSIIDKGKKDGSIRPDVESDTAMVWIRSFTFYIITLVTSGLEDYINVRDALRIQEEFLDNLAAHPDRSEPNE